MEKKVKYEGWLNIHQVKDTNKNGVKIDREVMTRSVDNRSDDSVAGILLDVNKGIYYFVNQYRAGVSIRSEDPYITEVVAGTLEKSEDPKECFKREAMEEVGFKVDNLIELSSLYTSPGGTSEKCYLYIATGEKTEIGGGLEQENEDIEVVELSKEEVSKTVFKDMKTQYLVNLMNDFL